MIGYHSGLPDVPGHYLIECDKEGSRNWTFREIEAIEQDPEKYPGQKMLYIFDHVGGNYFGQHVQGCGTVIGYIPMMEMSGPVIAKRLYLNLIRCAWYFDMRWATNGSPRDIELAWVYVLKAVEMAKQAAVDPASLPDDMPSEAYHAAIEAIESVKYSKYTKLLGLLVNGNRDPDLTERPSLLPFTVAIRMGHDTEEDTYKVWDLMIVDGVVEAIRERDRAQRMWLDNEIEVEKSTFEDVLKWLQADTRYQSRQVRVGDSWCTGENMTGERLLKELA